MIIEIGMIPGLLQTEAYARAMCQAGPAELSGDEVEVVTLTK